MTDDMKKALEPFVEAASYYDDARLNHRNGEHPWRDEHQAHHQFTVGQLRALRSATTPSAPVSAPAVTQGGDHPIVWIIPGDEPSRDNGFVDAMAFRDGEFTRPLYAHPPAAKVDAGVRPRLGAPDTTHRANDVGQLIKYHSEDQIYEFAAQRVAHALASQPVVAPIVVDIAKAVEQLESSPELAATMSELINAAPLQTAFERIETLETALKPFADASDELNDKNLDTHDLWDHFVTMTITAGDLRRAKAAVADATA